MFRRPPSGVRALRRALEQAGVPCRQLLQGDGWQLGSETHLEVLHPPPQGVAGSDNANSVVLLLSHQQRRVLLPGDLEALGLERLLAQPPVRCDVVLVPHHGSRHSRPLDVARWAQPTWLIVSGGHQVDLAALRAAEKATGARLLLTADCGAVTVRMARQGVKTQCWRAALPEDA
jgi:competence protein ComEC